MKKFLPVIFVVALIVAMTLPVAACADTELKITAKEAVLTSEDGQVLFEYNATEKRPIASMTKIMTLLCVYDAIDCGKVSLDNEVAVSSRAASMGGSQVFLDANTKHKLSDLVKSVIVCSANDSCVALAEHISGSVENFVDKMNEKAEELALVATHFENCTGLPQVNQFSCALDVAKMMQKLIKHPHYFECSRIWMEDYNHPGGRVTGMTNTNKLVRFYEGCDGGKTGYTAEAQHCLSATAKRGDTRLISVVVGAPDSKTRFAEVSAMFNYGFANYECKVMLDENSAIDPIDVVGGKSKTVQVVPKNKLVSFGKKGETDCTLVIDAEKVCAPIKAGQPLGKASLVRKGDVIASTELLAATNVEAKTYFDYLTDIVYAN